MTPVYTPDGDLFAPTVRAAARLLDCSAAALYAHVMLHGDGWRLISYPNPVKVRAGRLHHPRGPQGEPLRHAHPHGELCAEPDCGRPRYNGTRFCQAHYMRDYRRRRASPAAQDAGDSATRGGGSDTPRPV